MTLPPDTVACDSASSQSHTHTHPINETSQQQLEANTTSVISSAGGRPGREGGKRKSTIGAKEGVIEG